MTRPSSGKVKVNIYFDPKMIRALRAIGHSRGITYSELIREAVRQYVFKEGNKVVAEIGRMKELVL